MSTYNVPVSNANYAATVSDSHNTFTGENYEATMTVGNTSVSGSRQKGQGIAVDTIKVGDTNVDLKQFADGLGLPYENGKLLVPNDELLAEITLMARGLTK